MLHHSTMKTLLFFLVILAVAYCEEDANAHDDVLKINEKLIADTSDYAYRRSTSTFGPQKVELFEGDIQMNRRLRKYLKKKREGKEISPFDAISNGAWPKGVVPFTYNRLPYAVRKVVDRAIEEYKKYTCIKFVPRTNERNYVDFFVGGGCYSMIGRQGGKQQISIGNGCGQIGVVIHEMMHALGFFHEQSRRDRDNFVKIIRANIPQRVLYNFEKYRSGQADTLGVGYDKQSVMHYGNYAFSNNGRKTIVSISNPNEVLGQRSGLSTLDKVQLNKYYKCSGQPVVTAKPPSGCTDGYSLCPVLAQNKLCNARVSTWAKVNCKKSCNNCPTPPKPQKPRCKGHRDANTSNCNSWKRSRYCENTSKYFKWMREHCPNCNECVAS